MKMGLQTLFEFISEFLTDCSDRRLSEAENYEIDIFMAR